MANIFSIAKELLDTKTGAEMNQEETELVVDAIYLLSLSMWAELPIGQGLVIASQYIEARKKGEQCRKPK